MHSTAPASSYRSRIAAHKSALAAAAAPVVAAVAFASIASTASAGAGRPTVSEYTVFTYGSSASGYFVAFDPIDGSTGNYDSTNPIGLDACGTASVYSGAGGAFLGSCSTAFVVSAGDVIDGSDSFNSSSYNFASGVVQDGSTINYLAFRFSNYGDSFDETYYGWVEFLSTGYFTNQILRTGIGPNNSPVTVGASAIPEPASATALFGTLALAACFGARRRRG